MAVRDLRRKAEYQRGFKQRMIAQAPRIPCGCGCGELMPSIKANGTPRRYINGHVPREHLGAWGKLGARARTPRPPKPANRCVDCAAECSRSATRCRPCSARVKAGPRRQPVPDRFCVVCGEQFERRDDEQRGAFLRRKTCGSKCRGELLHRIHPPGKSKAALCRRGRWHIKDACERCGSEVDLQAHHRDEDRTNNEPANIETLCRSCHLEHHA